MLTRCMVDGKVYNHLDPSLITRCGKDKNEVDYSDVNLVDDNYRTYYEIFVYSFCDSDGDGIGAAGPAMRSWRF